MVDILTVFLSNVSMKKILSVILLGGMTLGAFANVGFVKISKENPRYFEANGKVWIPNGYNLCFPRPYYYDKSDDEAFALIEKQLKALAENNGNFIRLWVSADFYQFETAPNTFDPKKLARLDRLMRLAQKYGIRVKLCLEHFRNVKNFVPTKSEQGLALYRYMFAKSIYANDFSSMTEYLQSSKGKSFYLARAKVLADRYRDNPNVFGVELWNEMNSVSAPLNVSESWTSEMLGKIKLLFPNHLVMQSLGSFSEYVSYTHYETFMKMKDNDVAQVHRYLDLGSGMDICKAAIDIFAADSVRVLREIIKDKPVLLAETGAVKPNHSGPSELYEKDKEGSILHDTLFSAFFSGAAGSGQIWHWEVYVLENNLFWHFGRFAKSIEHLNPIAENSVPTRADTDDLRVYVLNGRNAVAAWVRDVNSDWRSELERGEKPATVRAKTLDFSNIVRARKVAKAWTYNPWTDKTEPAEVKDGKIALPDFRKSLVVRLEFAK